MRKTANVYEAKTPFQSVFTRNFTKKGILFTHLLLKKMQRKTNGKYKSTSINEAK